MSQPAVEYTSDLQTLILIEHGNEETVLTDTPDVLQGVIERSRRTLLYRSHNITPAHVCAICGTTHGLAYSKRAGVRLCSVHYLEHNTEGL